MRKFILTNHQRRRLRQLFRDTDDEQVKRRVAALLAVAAGEAVASVARRLGVTPRTIYHWVAVSAQERDPAALRNRPRSGRPLSLTEQERSVIGDVLRQSPREFGYISRDRWTVWLLQFHLFHLLGRWPADETIRREIRRQGWVWRQSRYVRAGNGETTSADLTSSANVS